MGYLKGGSASPGHYCEIRIQRRHRVKKEQAEILVLELTESLNFSLFL